MLYQEITLEDTGKLNNALFDRFLALMDQGQMRQTHHFAGRYENTYIDRADIPAVEGVEAHVRRTAAGLLQREFDSLRCGFWFNAMQPGHVTQAHHHDENDELLSAVYYIRVPADSGDLVLHEKNTRIVITPTEGRLVLFAPAVVHEVTRNNSDAMRLSVAFNVGPAVGRESTSDF